LLGQEFPGLAQLLELEQMIFQEKIIDFEKEIILGKKDVLQWEKMERRPNKVVPSISFSCTRALARILLVMRMATLLNDSEQDSKLSCIQSKLATEPWAGFAWSSKIPLRATPHI